MMMIIMMMIKMMTVAMIMMMTMISIFTPFQGGHTVKCFFHCHDFNDADEDYDKDSDFSLTKGICLPIQLNGLA